ncbi:Nramp family divalent metal transporter [Flagellimonas lutaonensis]|uniref:Mn2+/Fe2+ transporter, NRAMP family protein n=1 Tax=Flagellimonas lutaonensis TaxID=516051 RepID=A0A0D5YX59_9FLAO|nr:Nramp family divalent metal transporter [Allomuricauda lutaonensis]AKA36474.1 Mn2+/Fe2+ transporter, NRAMP family protein [Allomuricauda lutaonensis]
MFKKIGPGALVAAAFIGPGTITACTLAGVGFGYALLWAVLLSVLATMFLQEMAARLGIVTQMGLADTLNNQLPSKAIRYLVITIVLGAILVGNAAYEAGNIGGAALGLEAVFGENHTMYHPYVVGFLSFILLWWGSYKFLEKVFMALIALMSISFLCTAILTGPDLIALLKGIFVPTMPSESLLTVMALIGTTIVPYNLFLHASLVNEKWKSKNDLKAARTDTVVSIALGGLVSMAIVVAAAAIPSEEVTNAMHLTMALEPLYGEVARYFMGIGLFAAGITSSITAPLAAAYVANSCFGWKAKLHDWRFRLVWMAILSLGVFFLSFGIKPIEVIKFAQIANGILLPAIAFLLVWMVNKKQLMGAHSNNRLQNLVAIIIVALTVLLGAKSIIKVLELA